MNAINLSPEARFAFACFLVAEINRHKKDIKNAEADLEALRKMGVPVDDAYDMGFVTCQCDFVLGTDWVGEESPDGWTSLKTKPLKENVESGLGKW
jgi:hypothetical protein